MTDDNIIKFPSPPDPWRYAQPSYQEICDRFELWSAPYFGMEYLIYATGSNSPPEPPTIGGTPKAANIGGYSKVRVAS
jgi:hypothetical protein